MTDGDRSIAGKGPRDTVAGRNPGGVKWLVALCALAATAAAQPSSLAPDQLQIGGEAEPPVVSVLTFGQGEPLFEKWGHAALCFSVSARR